MKTLKTMWLNLSVLWLLIGLVNNCYSQFVQSSNTYTEVPFGTTVNGRYTGNDILDEGGLTFEVSVWDDLSTSPGFGYNVYGSSGPYTNYFSLQNTVNIIDPDVCLTVDGGNVYALVVYYDGNNGEYVLDSYDWNSTGFSYGNTYTTGAVTFGTTVNIDADEAGNFIFIYDEGGSNKLWAVTGDCSGGTLNINNSGTPVYVGYYPAGFNPDVCIYGHATDRVTYTYVNDYGLNVDNDDFSVIAGGGTNATQVYNNNSAVEEYSYPRIACPNPNSTSVTEDDWTVVVWDTDGSSFYQITGFNYDNNLPGVTGPTQYNDGTYTSPSTDITGVSNYGPVVAYTYANSYAPTIIVGWNFVNLGSPPPIGSPATANAVYPLVVQCDERAVPVQPDYWEVPFGITATETMDYLSLAGRNTDNSIHCTFFNQDQSDVFYKTVNNIRTASNMKIQIPLSLSEDNDLYNGSLIDLTGSIIATAHGSVQQIKSTFKSLLFDKTKSIYFIELNSIDGKTKSVQRVIN